MWPFSSRSQNRNDNAATQAHQRALDALEQSKAELVQTQHEVSRIRRELEQNHFGQRIYEDMMRRRDR